MSMATTNIEDNYIIKVDEDDDRDDVEDYDDGYKIHKCKERLWLLNLLVTVQIVILYCIGK